jgi:hypothetical protein
MPIIPVCVSGRHHIKGGVGETGMQEHFIKDTSTKLSVEFLKVAEIQSVPK